ncbi:MAG: tetratricopeptide repeat protein [Candidatus Aminicenantes bacterium]|nr:tetratricopeptide repeat protein [Candidatus Aminicenantes bacterium]
MIIGIAGLIVGVAGVALTIYGIMQARKKKTSSIPQSPPDEVEKKSPPQEKLFLVPYLRNTMLRHEDEWIDKIREKLGAEGKAVISQNIALHGQGGSGKTAMAIEYAYCFAEEYPGGVFWLQMEGGLGPAALAFLIFADQQGIHFGEWKNLKEQDQINMVVRFISDKPHKLVILDNVDDDILPKELAFKDCHLIVTTRRSGLPLPLIRMDLPDKNEAVDIFCSYADREVSHLSEKERKAVLDICQRVDRLPLALEILGQLVRKYQLSDLARKIKKEMVSLEATTTAKEVTSVLAALNLTGYDFHGEKTKNGLLAASYLNPDMIDTKILAQILEVDENKAAEITAELAGYCILIKGKDVYKIHRLTQEAARTLDVKQKVGQKVVKVMDNRIKRVSEKGIYKEAYGLIPHIIQVASLAAENLPEEKLPSSFAVSRWASFLKDSGYYSLAESLFRNCLERVDHAKGEVHKDYAAFLNNLALVLEYQGKYEEAEKLYRQALDIDEKTIGREHPGYAKHLNNLAGVLEDQG